MTGVWIRLAGSLEPAALDGFFPQAGCAVLVHHELVGAAFDFELQPLRLVGLLRFFHERVELLHPLTVGEVIEQAVLIHDVVLEVNDHTFSKLVVSE